MFLTIVVVQDLRSLSVSWPFSFKTEEERNEITASKPFGYIGFLVVSEPACSVK